MIAKHIFGWILTALLLAVAMPWMLGGKSYADKLEADKKDLAAQIGQTSAQFIIAKSDHIYASLFQKTGVEGSVSGRFNSALQNDGADGMAPDQMDKLARLAEGYVDNLFLSFREVIFRLTQLAYWAVMALPFLIAAGFDGVMLRKVHIVSFKHSSPIVYNTTWHFIIALCGMTFILCNSPFPMPALAYPVAVFLFAMSMRVLLANVQRSA